MEILYRINRMINAAEHCRVDKRVNITIRDLRQQIFDMLSDLIRPMRIKERSDLRRFP